MFGKKKKIVESSDVLVHVDIEDSSNRTRDWLPTKFKVVVWNVEKSKEINFRRDLARLAQDAELILIQEWTSSCNVASIAHVPFEAATSFQYEESGARTGVATGSIATLAGPAVAQVTPDVEPFVKTPKTSLITEYTLDHQHHQRLTVINIHGRNRGGLQPLQAQLERLSPLLSAATGPVIFAGDFNTNNAEKANFLFEFAKRHGLQSVEFAPDNRTVSKLSRQPLDHVFVSEGLSVEQAICYDQSQINGSDHQPMELIINVK